MLETLVSSRIRRALLEYILTHQAHRFYLRGLAKELGLSLSPLRRELKRLEHLGMLRAYQEANIRFYVVDSASAQFAQLKATASAGIETATAPVSEPLVASTVITPSQIERIQRVSLPPIQRGWQALTRPLSWPVVVGMVSMGLMGVLVVGGLTYLAVTNQRLLALTRTAVSTPRSQVTVVESAAARPTGEMRSSRWRLTPGAMGGFSSGAAEESY